MELVEFVKSKIDEQLSKGTDNSFYVLNLEDVRLKYRNWIEKFPRVVPFYAVKCNDDERVLKLLAELGAGFDCASSKEIAQILNLNVEPSKIVYTHTAKQLSHLKYSADKKIEKLTFDSIAELEKIKKYYPTAKVVLRIRFDAKISIINLGTKFGCNPDSTAKDLIKCCKDMKMNLIGISFHVGSGAQDYDIFQEALSKVRELFDFADTLGLTLNFVDIGGGFIGKDLSLLDHYAKFINAGIGKYFSNEKIEIISEPGRYFVDSAFSIAAQIILKRHEDDGSIHYFLNESIYMSFLISHMYEEKLDFTIIRKSEGKKEPKEVLSTIWGCSCNSKDKIIGDQMISELEMGDWLLFHNMGAYSITVSTKFNGFAIKDVFTIN